MLSPQLPCVSPLAIVAVSMWPCCAVRVDDPVRCGLFSHFTSLQPRGDRGGLRRGGCVRGGPSVGYSGAQPLIGPQYPADNRGNYRAHSSDPVYFGRGCRRYAYLDTLLCLPPGLAGIAALCLRALTIIDTALHCADLGFELSFDCVR